MENLLFENPVFHTGINSTVRRGIKWASFVGQRVYIHPALPSTSLIRVDGISYNKLYAGCPIILKAVIKRFKDITFEDIQTEHNPECVTKEGLIKAMIRIYGNKFSENDICTILYFEVEGDED